MALWWWLGLLLLWHRKTCYGLSSHFQAQEGESLASFMQTLVEELSSSSKRDLFQMGGGREQEVFIYKSLNAYGGTLLENLQAPEISCV